MIPELGRIPDRSRLRGMYVRGTRDPNETVNMNTGAIGTCCLHPLAAD